MSPTEKETQPLLDDNGVTVRPATTGPVPFRIYIVSIGFTVLFLAYNSLQVGLSYSFSASKVCSRQIFLPFSYAQNYVTSLLPGGLGNQSLAVLYISVCAFVFLSPPIVRYMGEKWTMVLGAACYVVYMASLIKAVRPVVLTAAVVIGKVWS